MRERGFGPRHFLLALPLALGGLFCGEIAAGPDGGKVRSRSIGDYLRGVWKGRATVEKGLVAGPHSGIDPNMDWELRMPTGDPAAAEAFIDGKKSKFEFGKSSPRDRRIQFKLYYDRTGGFAMLVQCKGQFSLGFSKIEGTFMSSFGVGSFTLKKSLPDLKLEALKGRWSGRLEPSRPAKKESSLPLMVTFTKDLGEEKPACTFISDDDYPIVAVEPSFYDASRRELDLCLLYKGKARRDPQPIILQGTFNETFTTWTGSYGSARAGRGRFELAKTAATAAEAKAPPGP